MPRLRPAVSPRNDAPGASCRAGHTARRCAARLASWIGGVPNRDWNSGSIYCSMRTQSSISPTWAGYGAKVRVAELGLVGCLGKSGGDGLKRAGQRQCDRQCPGSTILASGVVPQFQLVLQTLCLISQTLGDTCEVCHEWLQRLRNTPYPPSEFTFGNASQPQNPSFVRTCTSRTGREHFRFRVLHTGFSLFTARLSRVT